MGFGRFFHFEGSTSQPFTADNVAERLVKRFGASMGESIGRTITTAPALR